MLNIILKAIYDHQEAIFYGPHECGEPGAPGEMECHVVVCRTAYEQGGVRYKYPEEPIYPNTKWELHTHPTSGEKGC